MGSGAGAAPDAPLAPDPRAARLAARARAGLALFLTGAGLLQIAGSALGSPFLIGVGQLTGVAPLPRVFSQRGGIDSFARRAVVEVWTADGERREIAVDRGFGSHVEGPVVRRAAYAHAALLAGLTPSSKPAALLERAFCAPADVARELGFTAPVERVRVRNWSALANDEPYGTLEVRCRRDSGDAG